MNATEHSLPRVSLARPRARGWTVAVVMVAALLAVAVIAGGCAAKPNTVDIHDLEFDPQTMTVAVGTTVTWTVNDQTAHIIQTDDFGVDGKSQTGQFASQPLSPGDSFSHTFDTAGTFTYGDPLQGYMTGTIVVK
jgi:plastocyanin